MADKEVVIDHARLKDPQKITQVVTEEFKRQGVNPHKNDCVDLQDDFSAGKRIYKLKKVKYFGPWSHRG